MNKEPKSAYMRYAFGYSDEKPSAGFWIVIALMVLYVITHIVVITA